MEKFTSYKKAKKNFNDFSLIESLSCASQFVKHNFNWVKKYILKN